MHIIWQPFFMVAKVREIFLSLKRRLLYERESNCMLSGAT